MTYLLPQKSSKERIRLHAMDLSRTPCQRFRFSPWIRTDLIIHASLLHPPIHMSLCMHVARCAVHIRLLCPLQLLVLIPTYLPYQVETI